MLIYRNGMERTDEDGEPRGKREVNSDEIFLSLHRAFLNLRSSVTNKCTIY